MPNRQLDTLTGDLFASIPTPASAAPGALACRREIAGVMAEAIKVCPFDRYVIAARMSRALGEDVSVNMLNAYTAESREEHVINLERAIAFDAATGGHALAELFVQKLGGRILWGRDVLLAERGRIEQQEISLKARKRAINDMLGKPE